MAYLLDANVLISAAQGPYAFGLCPGYWDWLSEALEAGGVSSVQAVLDELVGRDDELSQRTRMHRQYFVPPDEASIRAHGDLLAGAQESTHYNDRAKAGFSTGADAPLIAHAQVHQDVLVTHETPSNEVGRIKIPNAAVAVGVRAMNPYAMLRREHVMFVLRET